MESEEISKFLNKIEIKTVNTNEFTIVDQSYDHNKFTSVKQSYDFFVSKFHTYVVETKYKNTYVIYSSKKEACDDIHALFYKPVIFLNDVEFSSNFENDFKVD